MDIVFSVNNNEKTMVIPVPPKSLPIEERQAHGDFDGLAGKMKLIGKREPKTFSFSSFFPNKKYHFIRPGAEANGWLYLAFFRECRERKVPLRVIIIYAKHKENFPCLIENVTWDVDKAGDITYTISVVEYEFPTAKRPQNVVYTSDPDFLKKINARAEKEEAEWRKKVDAAFAAAAKEG